MKISCEIVKDLIPLYYDEVCSSESRIAVDEHIQECENCKNYLDSMKNDFIQNDTGKEIELSKADTLKRIKKKLLKKNVIISMISILCAVGLFIGGFSFIFHKQMPITYEEGLFRINKANDGSINIIYNGDDYYCSYGLTKTIKKDGKEQKIAYIYYTNSIWTKYFAKRRNNQVKQFSIDNNVIIEDTDSDEKLESKKDISAVYYFIGDYHDITQLSDEEFSKLTQNAIPLWKK